MLHLQPGNGGKGAGTQPGPGGGSGGGMGGPGQGAGGKAPESDGAVEFKPEKLRGKPSGRGKITGSIYVKGVGQKGEASAAYHDAAEAFDRAREDALEEGEIPLERRNLVRDYFDRIRPGEAGEKK